MALFTKQDFTPPILSKKWIAIKFRPNMLLYSRDHIISILESGLLFREDSIEVEQEVPSSEDALASAGSKGWFTSGERTIAALATAASVFALPPRSFNRSTLVYLCAYATVPVAVRALHRFACGRRSLRSLLTRMRDYLALARRAAACLKEYRALHIQLDSTSSVLESTHTMLCRQQNELSLLLSRASSAVLGNAPWLRSDVAWDALHTNDTDLMKIHHAFLVVQSTLLKHIAMAHHMPSIQAKKIYKNHNERIYWLHTTLIPHLDEEFKQNYEALDRMYRLLKNFGNTDLKAIKTPGFALNDKWLYSEVHSGIASACLEMKFAINKCTNLDMFLDSCALNKQELDLNLLNNDIDVLIEILTKCLTTVQNSQIRLKKLQRKFGDQNKMADGSENGARFDVEEDYQILKIEDKDPETKDEVFYFVKTDDDVGLLEPIGDVSTAPGKTEREATKVVLNELKRKLVRREDLMRERERQALSKTMPELKDNLPEFPRQINIEDLNQKGFIWKIHRQNHNHNRKLFKTYLICTKKRDKNKRYRLKTQKYQSENEIPAPFYEGNSILNVKSKLLSVTIENKSIILTKWYKSLISDINSELSELSDLDTISTNTKETSNDSRKFKFTKKDLELTSSSGSEFELGNGGLLNDVRRHRVFRKKNFPIKRLSLDRDEGSKPIEYSFGTGMAMASVLQVNKSTPFMQEEVFMGDGEVSEDSGNDADA